MRLDEIDNRIRKEKKVIDGMFINNSVYNSVEIRNDIIRRINNIYPTGYPGIDTSLEEYKNLLYDDLINKLKL